MLLSFLTKILARLKCLSLMKIKIFEMNNCGVRSEEWGWGSQECGSSCRLRIFAELTSSHEMIDSWLDSTWINHTTRPQHTFYLWLRTSTLSARAVLGVKAPISQSLTLLRTLQKLGFGDLDLALGPVLSCNKWWDDEECMRCIL